MSVNRKNELTFERTERQKYRADSAKGRMNRKQQKSSSAQFAYDMKAKNGWQRGEKRKGKERKGNRTAIK